MLNSNSHCSICLNNKLIAGTIEGFHGAMFVPETQKNKIVKESYKIKCYVCSKCGNIVKLELKNYIKE